MKTASYAIILGVYMALLGPVLLIAPTAVIATMEVAVQESFQVATVLIVFAMISTLVLVHKPVDKNLTERLVRVLAWLTLIKVVVLFWNPALLAWSIDFYHKIPLTALRIEGLLVSALGAWLIYWGTEAIRQSSETPSD